jgi:hypothetical protein
VAESDRVTGRQIAAGRTLIGMSQPDLAASARISVQTLRRMEASEGPSSGYANNVAAVRAALESVGVIFVEENGEGPGVRLKKRSSDGENARSVTPYHAVRWGSGGATIAEWLGQAENDADACLQLARHLSNEACKPGYSPEDSVQLEKADKTVIGLKSIAEWLRTTRL